MFKRFISISHLGRFETHTALEAHEFLKWNIIYGKNGKGKSTLTALLKSVGENQPNYLLARKTLGQPNTPNAKLLFINDTDGSSISVEFNGITWDQTPQKILVFDQDFIDTNIFLGTHIDYTQKRGLYEIFVGRQTGSLVKQISIEDEKIKKINPEINSTRTQINYNIKSTLSIEDFMKLPKPSSGENLIPTLEKQIKAIQNKTTIMQKPLQQELLYSLPNIDKLDTILQTSVKTIADDVTQAIKTKVAIIDEQDAETWIEKGHKFSQKTEGKCPYCWQAMSASELLNQYEEYFNQEYKNALSTLRTYKEEVLQKFNSNSLITLSRIISENEEGFKYWQSLSVKELQNMEFGIDELQSLLTELRKLTKDILDKKLQNPLIPVTIPKQLSSVIDKISEKSDELKEYNDVIKNNNKLIVSFKKYLMGSDNVVDLRTKLYTEQDQYNRYTPSIDSLCKKYETLINLKAKYEATKSKLRLQLDESSQKILEEHQKSINDCLIKSGASFSLHRIDQSHLGGRPNSTFVLEINGEEIPADSETEDSPSLKTALSTGDRTTLAFAFFVSCALQDNDLNKTILVIDDPISSLDYERRNHTVNIIFDLFSR
jgi:wobble nucleotide-excising tRNase